jgi:hypothetical protein
VNVGRASERGSIGNLDTKRTILGSDEKIGFGSSGLESMDLENASAEDIIASVEKMIKNEETKNT